MKFLFTAVIIFLSGISHAQWTNGGTPLSSTPSYNNRQEIAMTNSNSSFVTWAAQDTTTLTDPNSNIYLTGIDKNGQALSGFTSGALQISGDGFYFDPQILITSDSFVIVSWSGSVNSADNEKIYVQKFSKAGVPQWNSGIPKKVSAGDVFRSKHPVIVSDKSGGIYISWEQSASVIDPYSYDLLMQRMDKNGNVKAGWSVTPIQVANTPSVRESLARLVVSPKGDAVYVQYFIGISNLSLWLKRVNASDGSLSTGFSSGSGVQLSSGPNASARLITDSFVFTDTAGNALSLWLEPRSGGNGEAYYQKTLKDGTKVLSPNGKIVAASIGEDGIYFMHASQDDDGGILAVWNDYSDPNAGTDIGGAKFNQDGTIAWTHVYNLLSTNHHSSYPKILPDHNGGSYAFYQDIENYPWKLKCLHIDNFGKVIWPFPGLLIGTCSNINGPDPQFEFQVANANAAQSGIVWNLRGSNTLINIFACYVKPSGKSCSDSVATVGAGVFDIHRSPNEIKIYPNPATDELNFSFAENISQIQLSLFNEVGEIVLTENVKENSSVTVSKLLAGFYIARFFDSKGNYLSSDKIIIQK